MSDPGKTISARIRYEVRLQPGPWTFRIRGVAHTIKDNNDAVVLVRQIVTGDRGNCIMEEKIVGIIGDDYESGCAEFIRLQRFLNDGGVIGLHRDLSWSDEAE